MNHWLVLKSRTSSASGAVSESTDFNGAQLARSMRDILKSKHVVHFKFQLECGHVRQDQEALPLEGDLSHFQYALELSGLLPGELARIQMHYLVSCVIGIEVLGPLASARIASQIAAMPSQLASQFQIAENKRDIVTNRGQIANSQMELRRELASQHILLQHVSITFAENLQAARSYNKTRSI